MNEWRLLLILPLVFLLACQTRQHGSPTFGQRPVYTQATALSGSVGSINQYRMTNGMELIHRERKTNDIVGMVLYVNWGGIVVPEEKAGLPALLSRVMVKGTKNRDSEKIADDLGKLGSGLSMSPNYDSFSISVKCLARDLDKSMEILADVALQPSFPEDQVEIERKQMMAQLRQIEDSPSSVAMRAFRKKLFGNHPYGNPINGTVETVPSLQRSDLINAHYENFVPSNMVLSAVGNVSKERFEELARRHFGDMALAKEEYLQADQLIYPGGSRTPIYRNVEQGHIIMGHVVCPIGHKDYPALRVASSVLGGGMSARLFRELRDKQGLAYSVGCSTSFKKYNGMFYVYIGTAKENIEKAEAGLWAEVDRLRQEPIDEQELQRAKNYIAGEYLRAHETNMAQASYLGAWYTSGLGVDYDDRFVDVINQVTIRDVMFVANKYFLDPTTVVIIPTSGDKTNDESVNSLND